MLVSTRVPAHLHHDKRRGTASTIKRTSERSYRFRWPAHLARLLGRVPDPVLAARAGVHPTTVAKERRRRGIAAFTSQRAAIKWTEKMLDLLGTDSDAHVAAELGLHRGSVSRMRRILDIPAFGPQGGLAKVKWTSRALALLGQAPDEEVARQLGLSRATVLVERQVLGIPSFRLPHPRIAWSGKVLGLLGRVPDTEIGRRFRINPTSIEGKRRQLGIPPYRDSRPILRSPRLKALLKLRTFELRKKYGLWPATVVQLRRELGVPRPYVEPQRWTPDAVARLGKEPDTAIARDLGITSGTVGDKRHRLGISAFRRPSRGCASWEE